MAEPTENPGKEREEKSAGEDLFCPGKLSHVFLPGRTNSGYDFLGHHETFFSYYLLLIPLNISNTISGYRFSVTKCVTTIVQQGIRGYIG